MTVYTMGHSTLSSDAFLEALDGRASAVLDVRSHPTSRWPQFRRDEMASWVSAAGLRYEWWPSLGGWDARHARHAEEMSAHGVDVSCYVRGSFPKQRIAKVNQSALDAGIDPRCPLHGCSSRTGPGIQEGTRSFSFRSLP